MWIALTDGAWVRGAVLLALSGCGRIAFDPVGDAAIGDSSDGIDAATGPQPFAYWKLDDGTGTSAVDSSGHGHTMSLMNGAAWTTGPFGGAVSTDGVDDYLLAPGLDLTVTPAVTVSAWVNRTYTTGPVHTLFTLSPNWNTTTTGFGLFPDDISGCTGQILLGVRGNVGYSTHCYAQPSSGVFHHLVAVFDKSLPGTQETSLYIDGVPASPVSSPSAADNTNMFGLQPFFVASLGGTVEYNVNTLDEIVIYDRALTPAEIAAL